jgi:hypothetical protein
MTRSTFKWDRELVRLSQTWLAAVLVAAFTALWVVSTWRLGWLTSPLGYFAATFTLLLVVNGYIGLGRLRSRPDRPFWRSLRWVPAVALIQAVLLTWLRST